MKNKKLAIGLYVGFWAVVIFFITIAINSLFMYFIATILAYMTYPLVKKIHTFLESLNLGYSVSRVLSIISLFIILIIFTAGFVYSLGGLLIEQLFMMGNQLNESSEIIIETLDGWGITVPQIANMQEIIDYLGLNPQETLQQGVSLAFTTVSTTFNIVLSIVLLPFFMFYIMFNPKEIGVSFLRLFPESIREDLSKVGTITNSILHKYIASQLFLSVIIFGAMWFGLSVINMPNAFALAVIAGVFELIPIFGPVIAWFVAFTIAIPMGIEMVIAVSIVSLIIQQIEGNFLVPKIQGETINFPAWLVMLVVTIAGSIGGIAGMILGLPIAAVFKSSYHYAYLRLQEKAPSPEKAKQMVENESLNITKIA